MVLCLSALPFIYTGLSPSIYLYGTRSVKPTRTKLFNTHHRLIIMNQFRTIYYVRTINGTH